MFPLHIAPNQRCLVDRTGVPFFVHADTGWRLPQRLTIPQACHYFDKRRAQGFNALHIHIINKEREGAATPDGLLPFDVAEDLTKPNEAYWQRIDALLAEATARGFLLIVSTHWFDYQSRQGYRASLTVEAARTYGHFLGLRYRQFDNLIWIHGGDDNPGDAHAAICTLGNSLRAVAPHHLQTYHALPEHPSATFFPEEPWLDINLAYTYKHSYQQVQAEYQRPGRVRPILLGETGYENETNPGYEVLPTEVRRQAYWALLSGACGHAYGSKTIWDFAAGWQFALDKPGVTQMAHLKSLFTALPWWQLTPDVEQHVLVSGAGEAGTAEYATAAIAADGSFALVYLPTARTITVDLSRLAGGKILGWWFNPVDGRTYNAQAEPTWRAAVELSEKQFTLAPPMLAQAQDWVLLLQTGQF